MAGIKLFVGLGNPGREYADTRHNAGAWFIDQLANHHQVNLKKEIKFHGLIGQVKLTSQPFWLFLPTTFMNESGKAVHTVARFYKIAAENILIAHDELDFAAGKIKLKFAGGHGGHNGIRSIIQHLSSNNFYRLRIGIGHPGDRDRVTPHVLNAPSPADKQRIEQAIQTGLRIIPDLTSGEFEKATRYLHNL